MIHSVSFPFRWMQKGQFAKTKIFKCSEKGWELKPEQAIKTGDFLIDSTT